MRPSALSDEALLAGRDPAGFEEFYVRHVEGLLGFFARRARRIKQHTTKEQPPWVPSKSPAF
ncbi:MAG TPA: hypothetical protein VJU80_17110 [Solirubrobacteraceae bacterium]|nr:hypothetical protein [Solirubrobacteraceae bacterium]